MMEQLSSGHLIITISVLLMDLIHGKTIKALLLRLLLR